MLTKGQLDFIQELLTNYFTNKTKNLKNTFIVIRLFFQCLLQFAMLMQLWLHTFRNSIESYFVRRSIFQVKKDTSGIFLITFYIFCLDKVTFHAVLLHSFIQNVILHQSTSELYNSQFNYNLLNISTNKHSSENNFSHNS